MTDPERAPLRILHISEVHWGGVVTLLRQYVAEQHAAGHEVHVLAPEGMPTIPGAAKHSWTIDRRQLTTHPRGVKELQQLVARLKPDVVHLHSFVAGQLGRLPAVLPRRRRGRPGIVYQPHAWSHELYTFAGASQGVALAERWAARRTDLMVVNCNDEAVAGRRLGVHLPARPLGVAVDLQRFRPPTAEERLQARAGLGLDDGDAVVLVLGRISRQKGQDLLVPRWEATARPGELLALVGPGDTTELSRSAPATWRRSIRAVGEPADVLPWLWACDVLAMPSRYETVGLVSAEAMATATPVVATAFDGARETILEGEDQAGAVVGAGDVDQLLHEVRRRLDDPGLRADEGQNARRRAERLFRPEPMAQRLEAAYREALVAAGGGQIR